MEKFHQLTLFIFRTLLLQFLCDVHDREGDDKMSVENEKMLAKLGSVYFADE
jgi:hypothetical protein